MRSPPTPSSLHWLIDRHARLKGDLKTLREAEKSHQAKLTKRLAQMHQAIAQAQSQETARLLIYQRHLKDVEAQIEATAMLISTHEVPIDPAVIRAVRGHKKDRVVPPGMITRAIYKVLGSADGPCSALQVAHFVIASLPKSLNERDASKVRYVVRQRMKNMTLEGKLVRCSDDPLSKQGQWTLPAEMLAMSPHETRQHDDAPASSHETTETVHS